MKAGTLWQELHDHPELSWHEMKTMEILKKFLRDESDLIIEERNRWFYGIHREEEAERTIAVRADMDGIRSESGGVFHGCGHDGHMAMAASAAAAIRNRKIGANVIFLFQPAEENGEGAKRCLDLFREQPVDFILGCHNIPGYPLGTLLLRSGSFACASRGMILKMTGCQSHAAYPEDGISPAQAIAAVLESLRTFESRQDQNPRMMATVVSVRCGSRNFGIQAGDGEICLTIRSETDDGLQTLQDTICGAASKAAERERLKLEISYQDVFPDTYNDPYTTDFFYRNLERIHLPVFTLQEPMRWSEDFGWYLKEREGLYFGIGSGPETPGLHTPSYMFPETLADKGGKTWLRMIMTASKYLESFK